MDRVEVGKLVYILADVLAPYTEGTGIHNCRAGQPVFVGEVNCVTRTAVVDFHGPDGRRVKVRVRFDQIGSLAESLR